MNALVLLYNIEKISTCFSNLTILSDSIFTYDTDKKIGNMIKELNIEIDLEIAKSLINDIDEKNYSNKTIILCLNKFKECLKKIEEILIKINEKLGYNQSLFLNFNWRKYKFDNDIENLKIYKKQFDDIYNKLLMLLHLHKN